MWSHSDARPHLLGCLGFLALIAAAIVAMVASLRSASIPTAGWVLASIGVAATMLAFIQIWRSQRRVAAYQRRRNTQAAAFRDAVLQGTNPVPPYFLYLRPFAIDGRFVEAPREGADLAYVEEYGWPHTHHDLESALALLVHGIGELVALSDQDGKAGAGYVRSTDATWRTEVRTLCEHAEGIFVVPFDYEGTAWEVEMITEAGWLRKTLAIMPAASILARMGINVLTRNYLSLWEAGRSRFGALGLPPYDPDGGIVMLADRRELLKGFGRTSFPPDRERALRMLRERLVQLASDNETTEP